MIINNITNNNIYNYLTEKDINIIDKNINKYISFFCGVIKFIKGMYGKVILYNQKYYFISEIIGNIEIIIINNNNYNDIKIYTKYPTKNWYIKYNNYVNIDYIFSINVKRIWYNNKTIEYNYNYNYKLIKIGNISKKIFIMYNYYIYYNSINNFTLLYYYNNYFLFILKKTQFRYIYFDIIKVNLNNIIINLLFFVYIIYKLIIYIYDYI